MAARPLATGMSDLAKAGSGRPLFEGLRAMLVTGLLHHNRRLTLGTSALVSSRAQPSTNAFS
eukprot:12943344-Alexandrium_andersonii.AAC.1